MKGNDLGRKDVGRAAAEWFVELDADADDHGSANELIAWLARSPAHEAAFERCEAAIGLARELKGDQRVQRWLMQERRPSRDRSVHWAFDRLRRPALAWTVAAAAVLVAAIASFDRAMTIDAVERELAYAAPDLAPLAVSAAAADPRTAPLAAADPRAAQLASADPSAARTASAASPSAPPALEDASMRYFTATAAALLNETLALPVSFATSDSVAVLPGDIVVDVHSVAVLPFDSVEGAGAQGEAAETRRIAAQLYDEVVRQLSGIPGVYVVARGSSAAYAGADLLPSVVAQHLGVRGVVEADVAFDGRRVRVILRLTDAVHEGRSIQHAIDRPLDELTAVRADIVSNIAVALTSSAP